MNLEAETSHDEFQGIIARMTRAGWLVRAFESSEGLSLHYSELGKVRMRRLAELAKPVLDYMRDNSKPKPSLFRQVVFAFRAQSILVELNPPKLSSEEINKLIAFMVIQPPD